MVYIIEEDAIEAVRRGCQEWCGIFTRCEENIKSIPPADVKPVIHGHWIERYRNGFGNMICECSNCHSNSKRRNFCFNCGADMRGNDNEHID